MSRSFVARRTQAARGALVCLGLALMLVCIPEHAVAQAPPAAPQLSAEERAAKLAERDRLWKEAGELRAAGKLDEALERLANNIKLQRALFGDKTTGEAESLEQIAAIQRDRGRWAEARAAASEALAICQKNYSPGDWHTVDTRLLAADVERWSKLKADMRAKLAQADRLLTDVRRLKAQGQYRQAVPLAEQTLAFRRQVLGDDHRLTGDAQSWLGILHDDMGDYARAEPLYKQALEIHKKALGEDRPEYATDLNNLALLYDKMGDYARAEPLYKQALEIHKKALGEDRPEYATDLNNLALLYDKMGDYARAEPLYKQALEIHKKTLGEDRPQYATDLNNLALLYFSIGDYARAEPLYKQALEIHKKALGEDRPQYATDLNNLAFLYFSIGDYARAEPLYKQALGVRKKAVGENHPDYALSLNNLGLLRIALGQPADAEQMLRQAVQIERKSLDLTAAVQSEEQQLAMAAQVRFYLDNYLSAALAAGTAPTEIYAEVAAWKGSVSAQQQLLRARQRALAADPNSQLGQLFAQLDAQTRQLATLTRYTPKPQEAPRVQQTIHTLSESVNTLQQQLSHLDPDFHRAWADRKISPADLRQALPADAALVDVLEYSHYIPPSEKGKPPTWERRLAAFVLRRNEPVVCVPLGTSALIGSLVSSWRAGYGRPRPNDKEKEPTGVALRRLLWEPLAPHLAGAKIVLVSPDGVLAQLPWGALPGDKPGTFLIEDRGIAVIAIPQMLPELLARPAHAGPPDSLLVAGDIDYGGDPGAPANGLTVRSVVGRMRDGHALHFDRLEAAQGELSSIRDWYEQADGGGDVRALRRRNATEAAFRDEAPKHPWLHLITHGFFAPDQSAPPAATPPAAKPADGKPALAGMGAALEVKDGHCLVTQLVDGGAAAKDGRLKAGDEIVAVAQADGKWAPVTGQQLTAIVSVIRGPLGTTVRIRVRPHEKPGQEIELALVRAALPTPAPRQSTEPVNPGLLSGLAFAGANAPPAEGKDDGILTALEVSSLDLSKVDTVVLSACETGLGQVAGGEGLLGLQRSFQVAGTKTVVASLWKVPDAATSRLMQRFYENMWDRKLGKLAALREAQIFMLRDQGNRGLTLENDQPADAGELPPYYWAAFVLSGDWR